jgi:trehalose 6-phosphate synthase
VVRLERASRARRVRREAHRTRRQHHLLHDRPDLADFEAYYNGFANRTLWPLLHFRMDLVDYSRETWAGYRRVNALFADRLVQELRDDDIIWVHDYHMIPMAQRLRERGVGNRIGFFLHVPMPSSDLLAALPSHRESSRRCRPTTSSASRPTRDLERFQDYVRLFGRGRVIGHGMLETAEAAGSTPARSRSASTPRDREQAVAPYASPACRTLRASLSSARWRSAWTAWIIRRAAGTLPRLRALPATASGTAWTHDVPADRAAVARRRARIPRAAAELEGLPATSTARSATPDWTPLRYVNRNYPHASLTGFYRMRRGAW